MNAQADLNLRWANIFEDTFSDVASFCARTIEIMHSTIQRKHDIHVVYWKVQYLN